MSQEQGDNVRFSMEDENSMMNDYEDPLVCDFFA